VPLPASCAGVVDVCGVGMDRVVFPESGVQVRFHLYRRLLQWMPHPIFWRSPFSDDVVQNLVSFANPKGVLTNSDLELSGFIVQHKVTAANFDVVNRSSNSARSMVTHHDFVQQHLPPMTTS
jgi:hypothetical protein